MEIIENSMEHNLLFIGSFNFNQIKFLKSKNKFKKITLIKSLIVLI